MTTQQDPQRGGTVRRAEDELAAIRRKVAEAITVNNDESTLDAVGRLCWLAHPESAGRTWFLNWQNAARMLRDAGLEPPPLVTRPSSTDEQLGRGGTDG